jgi:GT2 family glycosyltransferase
LKISVIIPTYNPVLKLGATLDKLKSEAKLIDELVIVADRKHFTKEADELLGKYRKEFNLKIVHPAVSGRGISRNKGAEVSSGEFIFFLDDDMVVEEGLLENHMLYHQKNTGCIVSGCGYRNPQQAKTDFQKYLIATESSWKAKSTQQGMVTLQQFNFTACNLSVSKELFVRLNGFDARFTDGEDFDFAVRAINSGIPIIYDVNLVAWHNDWPSIKAYIRRQIEYVKAKNEIFKIHPGYKTSFPNMVPKSGSPLKRAIAFLCRRPILWFVDSQNIIFDALPQRLKYRLFDWAISFNVSRLIK